MVIRDGSVEVKASENAAANSGWMNGWKNQERLTGDGKKPQTIPSKGYMKKRSR
ncbi:hypothetical protein HF209_19480 [Pseudomonas sp. WS 5096]|uniref:Uncharacterized protein n=1 Tax=Pseudomonas cremoris TaxID=2724178 RepID=A0ABR6TAZ4_9PSED|nr:hypothetical protein [Pseudomonas cremoris]MBC2383123.1 hypothetical protein [Pseudomonas cremoris]